MAPRVVPWPRRLRVRFGGETVADTRGADAAAPARLPARVLAAARATCASICWSRATGRRSRPTAARRPTGTCASASRRAESAVWTYRRAARGLAGHARPLLVRLPLDGRVVRGGGAHLRARARSVPARRCAPQLAPRRRRGRRRRGGRDAPAGAARRDGPDHALLRPARRRPRSELLEPSETFTECPYKGRCDYWSVRTPDGVLHADAAWCYRLPLADVGAIAGHVCFWQEREDTVLRVDGEVLPRPLGDARRRRRGGAASLARPARDAAAGEHARRGARRPAARPRTPQQPRRGPAGRRHGHGPRTRRRPPALALLTYGV